MTEVNHQMDRWSQQSPINLTSRGSLTYQFPKSYLKFAYPKIITGTVKGDPGHGANIEFADPSPASVMFDGKRCPLLKLHVHSGSEHKVEGTQYPIEIHFVHKIDPSTSGSTFVVVGVFLQRDESAKRKKGIAALADFFREHKDFQFSRRKQKEEITLSPNDFLPGNKEFFRYEGSLTTDPFSETVSWVVMRDVVPVHPEQLDPIVEATDHLPRMTQPLNRRFVLRSF